jgi:hypothetical protein
LEVGEELEEDITGTIDSLSRQTPQEGHLKTLLPLVARETPIEGKHLSAAISAIMLWRLVGLLWMITN